MTNEKKLPQWARYLIAITFCCHYVPSFPQEIPKEKLDRLCAWLENNSQGMGSIAIAKKGKIAYANAFGNRVCEGNGHTRSNTDTKYHIWSVTKMYTAVMILQLIQERKLSFTTTLGNFFPQIPNASVITIRQMLSHKSGIPDFTQISDSMARPKDQSREEMVSAIAGQQPGFPNGERFDYSNSNYLLLGYILEETERSSYPEILSKRIVSRLGLNNTFFGSDACDTLNNKALSYAFNDSTWRYVDEGEFCGQVPGGAGSIVATPSDMTQFVSALFSGKLLSPEMLSEMIHMDDFYGLGIMKMPFEDYPGFGHGGGYIASHALLVYHPHDSLAIAYCTNGHRYAMQSIISHVANIIFDPEYTLPFEKPRLALGDAALKEYVGKYEAAKFSIDITLEGNTLMIQPNAHPKTEMFPIAQDRFLLYGLDMEVIFERDPQHAKLTALHVTNGGKRKITAHRISSELPAKELDK